MLACTVVVMVLMTPPVHAQPLAIPGTGACEAVLKSLAQAFGADKVSIPASVGSGGGIKAVRSGQASIARVSRPLTDEERASGLQYMVFARDAAVFVAGSGAQVKGLTSAQVRDIFSGAIQRWSDVGGANVPIRVVTREASDAGAQTLRKAFPAFADAKSFDGAKLAVRDQENIELLVRYRNAIGLSAQSEVRSANDRLVYLTVDGKAATPDTIRSGEYPAVLEHAFIWKAKPADVAAQFLAFVQGPEGKVILERAGLVPVAGR